MNRTTEKLLTWAPLGAGLALMLSDHKRLGLLVAMASPATVWWQHPRATRRALRSVPRALRRAGEATGRAMTEAGKGVGRSARETGRGLRWMVS
jgi:hypothetical protein